ncbi:MAG: hypothetical protein MSS45_03810 [Fusobacterium mortiferum]|nr:hypothetical protein [Fusobacterium mortiferum]MDD7262952.1 hypothetical protein [Fusobacterium mortiferum]MDY5981823.1 hypothetical protein [Fusobacterium mortiferum]
MLIKFYIPILYSFITRVSKIETKISYFYVFILPNLFLSYIAGMTLSKQNFYSFILSFLVLNMVYEIGYIYNDAYTTQFEKNPTLRLKEKENNYLLKHYPIMIAFRIQIIIIIFIYLQYFINIPNLKIFIINMGLLNLTYAFHNYYRGIKNLVTMFFLMFFKYLAIPFIYIKEENIGVLLIFILTIPCVRVIIYTAHERAKINLNLKGKNIILGVKKEKILDFRLKYYFILIMVGMLIIQLNKTIGIYLTFYSGYFYIFYLGYFILKKVKNRKEK